MDGFKGCATHAALLAGATVLGTMVGPGGWELALRGNLSSVVQAQTLRAPVGFADIVEKVKPAVISVRVQLGAGSNVLGEGGTPSPQDTPLDEFLRRFGLPNEGAPKGSSRPREQITGQGSGFFISADGYAVTNNHVVESAQTVQVITDDGKTYTAKVVGTDPRSDIALIKVDGRTDFPSVKLAEGKPRIGDWVLAVGNPFGLGGTVTAGIVSARGRDIGEGPYDDFIQIDAPVNRGNSGGPTFDVEGDVIGVNTAIVSPSGGSVGIAFAVPAETVKSVVAQLKAKGRVTRGYIGVQIQDVTTDMAEDLGLKTTDGALIAEPQANAPAAKAGIEAGDVITAINDQPVKDAREVARTISSLSPGGAVKVTVTRDHQEKTINVTLGELPNERQASVTPAPKPARGTNVAGVGLTVAPQTGAEGVVVTGVDPNGVAAENGFRTGDIILEIAGKKVSNAGDISSALQVAQRDGKRTVLMRVKAAGGTKYVALPVGRT